MKGSAPTGGKHTPEMGFLGLPDALRDVQFGWTDQGPNCVCCAPLHVHTGKTKAVTIISRMNEDIKHGKKFWEKPIHHLSRKGFSRI